MKNAELELGVPNGIALDLRQAGARRFVSTLSRVSCNTLRQQHHHLLIVDAASSVLQVGWIETEQADRWVSLESEAGTGLYQALVQLAVNPNDADAFVFCEGPGSMLGIRTIVTAFRTWSALRPRPIFAYRSLELAAANLEEPGATLICDARRQSWHTLTLDEAGQSGEIQRRPTAELPAGAIYTLAGFRSWTSLPAPAPTALVYDARQLADVVADLPLLFSTPDPDAFQPERPEYAKWTPRVHQAPAS